jgi:magnesium chelatase subunit I
MRRNLLVKLRDHEPLFPGIVGYDESVIPEVVNAVLSKHHMILLGLRGQAKTRLIRQLVSLLDERIPVVKGCEIRCDPFAPLCSSCKEKLLHHGDDVKIDWLHRDERYVEKLATPDVTIADMLGDLDPIKAAKSGHILSSEGAIHYGLLPRSNRGIFAINELPDLAERIQVALLNVLEERDVQVRGYKIRLPLDVMLVASANPEDYTSRGRMITPLKDRFGAQVRTHYPLDVEAEIEIMNAEAARFEGDGVEILVPEFMNSILAEFTHLARRSPHISQHSGVSVRMSITNLETLQAAALRRALVDDETVAVPRVSDLDALAASTLGKVEIETFEDSRGGQVVAQLMSAAVLGVFRERVDPGQLPAVIAEVGERGRLEVGADMSLGEFRTQLAEAPALARTAASVADVDPATPVEKVDDRELAALASAAEFILEGLHLAKRLNKDAVGRRSAYGSR